VSLLEVEDLRVGFETDDGLVRAVDGVSFSVDEGRTLGLVGESGSGKSVASLTILGLTRYEGAAVSGRVSFDGRELTSLGDDEIRAVRGNDIAMVFQDPLSSLHPFYTVGDQIAEAIRAHRDAGQAAAKQRAAELLAEVGIAEARQRVDYYPHEFSGGMRQRVMIAMALANEPRLLIADEPTTALDVTTQAQILELIGRLQVERGMAVILITHDLGVVAENADEVAVMYAGRIVERAGIRAIFEAPRHPYTWGLLGSIPSIASLEGERLIPIPGQPPSLISPPSGCRFHPRCPYVRPRHREVDPALEPLPDDAGHLAACLLDPATRARLWAELKAGREPAEARRAAGIEARDG
jgi:peptide/nickel transport system ATP-binding protein